MMPDMLDQTPDHVLMLAVQHGDAPAFAALVTRHHRRLHSHAWRILQDATAAEDVVQDAMLKLWRSAHKFDASRGTLAGWLTRMVTNQCLDVRRALRPVDALEHADLVVDMAPLPDCALDRRHLARALAAMPARQRAVLALFYLEGLSMREVADQMDANVKVVESLLTRGRASLRALLDAADAVQETLQ